MGSCFIDAELLWLDKACGNSEQDYGFITLILSAVKKENSTGTGHWAHASNWQLPMPVTDKHMLPTHNVLKACICMLLAWVQHLSQ